MKPITEEQRQQLISLARIEISRWKLPADKQYMVDLMEIALASLTAEPVGSITGVNCINGGLTEARVYMRESGAPNKLGDIYIIPPVPVIKCPDSLQDAFEESNEIPSQTSRCGDRYCSHSFNNWKGNEFINEFNGFRKGVDYVKRLNGLGE